MDSVAAFLEEKGISREVADDLGVVFSESGVAYPNGRTRTWDKQIRQPSGAPLKPWWLRARPHQGQEILVCEGETDALAAESANRLGLAVVSIPGASCPPDHLLKQVQELGNPKVYLAFDGDKAGAAATEKYVDALSQVCPVAVVPIDDGADLSDTLAASEDSTHTLTDLIAAAEEKTNVVHLTPQDDGLHFITADEIKHEEVRWLSEGRVPMGQLTVLAGDGGLGKSTWTTYLAAAVSTGESSGVLAGIPSLAMILNAEDDPATTIAPRIKAAGGNPKNVFLMREPDRFMLPEKTAELRKFVEETRPKLLILDPLVALYSDKINSNNNQDTRRALGPLVKIAMDFDVAIVAVAHLNKSEGTDLSKRLGGSGGLHAAARSVLFFGRDPADPRGSTRILAHGKGNLGRGATQKFKIESVDQSSKLTYLGESPFSVEDSIELGGSLQEVERRMLAVKFLREELEFESQSAQALQTASRHLGLNDKDLTFARKETGATFFKESSSGKWMLQLPKKPVD